MRILRSMGIATVLVALSFAFVPKASAEIFDQKTTLTFKQPTAIPEKVLDPGTYVFKVILVQGDRDIMQVLSSNQDQVLGTYITLTKLRAYPTGDVVVSFREVPAGSPPAIDAWWYPGYVDGHQFIYGASMGAAIGTAKVETQPAPSMPEEIAPSLPSPPEEESTPAMENAPAAVEEPNSEPQATSEPAAASLPKTASSLPLVGLIGLLSLAAAFGLLIVTRRVG